MSSARRVHQLLDRFLQWNSVVLPPGRRIGLTLTSPSAGRGRIIWYCRRGLERLLKLSSHWRTLKTFEKWRIAHAWLG